ncbi:MAG: hypothetical protein U0894_16705 [Pirellulales bacterium]
MNAAEYQLSTSELSPELAAIAKHLQKSGVEASMRSAADHLRRSRWDAAIRLEPRDICRSCEPLPQRRLRNQL